MLRYNKFKFYVFYIYYVFRIPIDVKKGRLNILVAEFVWLLNRLFKVNIKLPDKFTSNYYETRFGKFFIPPDLICTITVSPVFERHDTNNLEKLIQEKLLENKKVLLVDIGGYFGDYAIRFGNRFKKNKSFEIFCFEPGTDYLSNPTLDQLKKNIKINNLKNIKLFQVGIGPEIEKNEIGIKTRPLDTFFKNKYVNYDVVFIKLDIDDYVIEGLEGIQKAVNNFKEVYLLVEDFVKPREALRYLQKNNYKFIKKISPYNSFWSRSNA